MELEDLEEVIRLDHLSFTLPWPESSFRFEIEKNEVSRCWVAEIQNTDGKLQIVGMIVVWFIVDEVHIATIAVSPDVRGKRIGQRLLTHTLIDAFHSGAQKAFLEVRRGNVAAIELYKKFGFIEVGIRKKYYQDNGEDAILMNLEDLQIERLEALV